MLCRVRSGENFEGTELTGGYGVVSLVTPYFARFDMQHEGIEFLLIVRVSSGFSPGNALHRTDDRRIFDVVRNHRLIVSTQCNNLRVVFSEPPSWTYVQFAFLNAKLWKEHWWF